MSYSKEQKEVLVVMGETLLMLQTAEKIIRLCMTFVFQKQSQLTFDLLQQQEQAERKKTIGYFLSELRKRANVDESFDLLLEDFLSNRNNFIHDLSRFETWDFHKKKDSLESSKLISDFNKQTDMVMKVFAGLIMSWLEQIQAQTGTLGPKIPDHEWFNEVEKIYKPLTDKIFFQNNS